MLRRFFLLVLPFILLACDRRPDDSLEPLWTVSPFTLTDQNGTAFSSEQLKGKAWIGTLFFTTCSGPCPMMAMRLREIQQAVNIPDLMLVSISCDPEKDTPEALKKYAELHKADPARWVFLTGKPNEVQKTAADLKLAFEPAVDGKQILHSTKFLLVDGRGQVRGIYEHDDSESMTMLKRDAALLAKNGI